MEEIIIKTLAARQHKNAPFDYWKYRYALSIDVVEIEDEWVEYYVTHKTVGTISNRRKGIAIVHSGNVFCLIDRDNNEILSTNRELIRIFGGYYVSLDEYRYDYRTFPGQDRDTEYETTTVIYEIYDEDGKQLNSKQEAEFFKTTNVLQAMTVVEIGEDAVYYKNALYHLSDYSCITKFQKNIRLEGTFIDGRCKVRIPEDDRDFIVAVYKHKICHVFTECEFERMTNVLNLVVKEEKNNYSVSKTVKKEEIENTDYISDCYPKAEISIEKYHASAPTIINHLYRTFRIEPLFTDDYIESFSAPGLLDYVISVKACKYYKNQDSQYLHIPYEGYKQLCESILEVNNNRPNYIKKITKLGKCIIMAKDYEMYRFECRPYGFITTSGELVYDFDVNNIKW